MAIATKPPKDEEEFYPSSDGKPMAETPQHRDLMFYVIGALALRYRDRPDVYVSGNDFLYYQQGDPKKKVSPDCYVVFGVDKRARNSYMVWKNEGKLPSVILEITSRKTRREDTHNKRPLYEQVLQIPENLMFDPTGDYLKPRLQGLRLHGEHYEAISLENGRLYSEQLGLDLVQEGEHLRLYDPVSGEYLLTMEEQVQRIQQEAQRADQEAQRAGQEAQARAAEKQRADSAEAEIARLRAELEALRRGNKAE